jgi:hypothetical protein
MEVAVATAVQKHNCWSAVAELRKAREERVVQHRLRPRNVASEPVQRARVVTAVEEDQQPPVAAAAGRDDADLRQPPVQEIAPQVVVDDLRTARIGVAARL